MALEAARQAVASGSYSPARWESHRILSAALTVKKLSPSGAENRATAVAMSPSEKKRVDAFARVMGPGTAPLRKLLAASECPEHLIRLFRQLRLDPKKQIDCQTLPALLAIHLFVERGRGLRPWHESKGSGLVKQLRKARRQFATNALAHAAFPLAFD